MPSTTSVRGPVADNVMSNSTELMGTESREAAQAARVEIFWIYQKIEPNEVDKAKAHNIPDTRIVSAKQGEGSYLLHVMFFCTSPCKPLAPCGIAGDIWISEPEIYVHTGMTWAEADMKNTDRTTHPFLGQQRLLALHPLHFALQWTVPSTIRQHRGKWKQRNVDENSHPGITELAQRADLKAIIATQYQQLNSAQISHYLSAMLPCFLDNCVSTDQPIIAQSSAATTDHCSVQPDNAISKDHEQGNQDHTCPDQSTTDIQPELLSRASQIEPLAIREDTDVDTSNHDMLNEQDEANAPQLVNHSAQPTYKCFPQNTYAGSANAISSLRQYRFFNGAIVGATPKLNIPGISNNIMEADEKLVEWMSEGQDATASSTINGEERPPIVEVIEYSSNITLQEKIKLSEKIHTILASSRAVALVPPTTDTEFEWSMENIGFLVTGVSGDCSTVVNWQSTRKRHIEHQKHRDPEEKSYWIDLCQRGTVDEFMKVVEAQTEPVNCLDASQAAGYAPELINLLANDCHAWNITNTIGYADIPTTKLAADSKMNMRMNKKSTGTSVEKERKEKEASIVDDLADLSDLSPLTSEEEADKEESVVDMEDKNTGVVSTRVSTKRKGRGTLSSRTLKKTRVDANRSKTQDMPGSNAKTATTVPEVPSGAFEFEYSGMRNEGAVNVERDVDRMRRWMLLGSAQFYTYPHHDAAGLITWTCLLNGLKIWSYVLPKEQPKNMEQASKVYTEVIQSLHHIERDTENLLPTIATAHNLFLFPGTLLIQPPGLIHQVLTVKNSVTRGGHLLTWNAMHLTEWTRKLSHNCYRVGTNDLHPGVQRTLGRMMIAISTRGPTKVLRKPFIALARLIIHAKQYWRGDYELNDETKLPIALKTPPKNVNTFKKEAWNEHLEAINIANAILRWNGIENLKSLDNVVDRNKEVIGFGSRDMNNLAWYETGNEMILIPKFPQL
ncbi:hypothetical protein BDY19DRAFT_995711 [Irpex rosettiformis]|uniref:Uncharacterized protein n=1 Tax=Irpex rosettiformis TaxID=378272 RepID=A0ACB8TXJ4_9APHY|nr:hypothetical protein BDY19DRAFT_995711 [Irpex rosettiformis]